MDPSVAPSQPQVPEPAMNGRSAWGFCCGSCCLLFLGLLIAFGFLMYRVGTKGVPQSWIDKNKQFSHTVGAIRTLFGIPLIKRTIIGIDADGLVRMIKPGMPKVADILKAMKPYSKT